MNVRIAIDLRDSFGLLAVWEYRQEIYINPWLLIKLTRPKEAISLCDGAPRRFVFPASVNPNYIRGKRKRAWKLDSIAPLPRKEQLKPIDETELKVLISVINLPGQSRQQIAQQTQINHELLKRYLRNLEKRGVIHYYLHPRDNRIRIYCPGKKLASLIHKTAS